GSLAARRHLAIGAVEAFHHVHPFDHLADRRETLFIQVFIVLHVEEQLRGARVWPQVREDQRPFSLPLLHLHLVVGEPGGGPQTVGRWVPVDAELHVGVGHTEEADSVVETGLDQRVEMVHADGRPVAMHLDHDLALRGIEDRLEHVRRFLDLRRGFRRRSFLRTSRQREAYGKPANSPHRSPVCHAGIWRSTTISPGSTIATGTRSSTGSPSLSWNASGCRACRAKDGFWTSAAAPATSPDCSPPADTASPASTPPRR